MGPIVAYRPHISNRCRRLSLLASVLLWVSVSAAASPASSATFHAQTLDTELQTVAANHNIPALAYGVFFADREPHIRYRGATSTTPFRWGSITKTVTALTLLRLAEVQQIDLHTPLTDLLPNTTDPTLWQNPWAAQQPIRLLHLLELTAGLPELSRLEFDYPEPLTLSAALQLAPAQRTTRWPPGQHHSYSNLTPALSQVLIEKLSKLDYASAVQRNVAEPLQMRDVFFKPRADLPGGFRRDGQTPIPYWHMVYTAFGAMNAPLEALLQLAMNLAQGERLTATQRRHLFQTHTTLAAREGFNFDYAAGLYPRFRQNLTWWGHGGDADGYRARLSVLPESNAGYVVVINTDNIDALRAMERILERHMAANLPRGVIPACEPVVGQVSTPLIGTYKQVTRRFGDPQGTITLSFDGQHLYHQRNARRTQLCRVAGNLWRRARDPGSSVAFTQHDGTLYVQGVLGNYRRVAAH